MTIAILPRLEKGDVVEIDFAIVMLIEETRVEGYTLQVLVEHNIEIAIGQLNSILCQTLLQVAEQQVSVVVFIIADKLLQCVLNRQKTRHHSFSQGNPTSVIVTHILSGETKVQQSTVKDITESECSVY